MTGRRPQRETGEGRKTTVVLDNARAHHARALTDPHAPTLDPTEHVRSAAKNNVANSRALAPENTLVYFTA